MTDYLVSQATDLWDITNSTSGDGSVANVNTGRALNAGNSSSATMSNLALGLQIGNHVNRVRIPTNVLTRGGPTGILASAPGYPTNNFGTMTPGTYVMTKVSTTLAGVSNTFLRSGGSFISGRRAIHKLEAVRTTQTATAIRANNWNRFNGSWDTSPNATEDAYTPSTNNAFSAFDQQAGRGATSGTLDDAASPTRALPGELIIHYGSGLPLNADYSARTTW